MEADDPQGQAVSAKIRRAVYSGYRTIDPHLTFDEVGGDRPAKNLREWLQAALSA